MLHTALGDEQVGASQSGGSYRLPLSIVVPLYNEEDNVQPLHRHLRPVLDGLGYPYEIIFVDDGSSDGTFPALRRIAESDQTVRVARLRRNFGQTAAMAAGFDLARGEVIVTLDGDLQNDPADIPLLMTKLEEGYDIVSGWRKSRQDSFSRTFPSRIANWLISRTTNVCLHDYGCTLKAYRSEVVKNLRLYGEMHRFIPAIANGFGVSVAELPVRHHPRRHGKSKYGIARTLKVLLDLLTVKFLLSYATRPLQVFGLGGVVSALLGGLALAYLIIERFVVGNPIGDRPLLVVAVLLVVVGVQLISMGLVSEMIARTYHESQGKPTYAIRELLDNGPAGRSELIGLKQTVMTGTPVSQGKVVK